MLMNWTVIIMKDQQWVQFTLFVAYISINVNWHQSISVNWYWVIYLFLKYSLIKLIFTKIKLTSDNFQPYLLKPIFVVDYKCSIEIEIWK